MAFSIRKAVAADARYMLSLFAQPHVREATRGPPSLDAFLSALQRSDQARLVIERDGRPFGYAGFTTIDDWLMEIRAIACVACTSSSASARKASSGMATGKTVAPYGITASEYKPGS